MPSRSEPLSPKGENETGMETRAEGELLSESMCLRECSCLCRLEADFQEAEKKLNWSAVIVGWVSGGALSFFRPQRC